MKNGNIKLILTAEEARTLNVFLSPVEISLEPEPKL